MRALKATTLVRDQGGLFLGIRPAKQNTICCERDMTGVSGVGAVDQAKKIWRVTMAQE